MAQRFATTLPPARPLNASSVLALRLGEEMNGTKEQQPDLAVTRINDARQRHNDLQVNRAQQHQLEREKANRDERALLLREGNANLETAIKTVQFAAAALKLQQSLKEQHQLPTLMLHLGELDPGDPDYNFHVNALRSLYPHAAVSKEGVKALDDAITKAAPTQKELYADLKHELGGNLNAFTERDEHGRFLGFKTREAKDAMDARQRERMEANMVGNLDAIHRTPGIGSGATISINGKGEVSARVNEGAQQEKINALTGEATDAQKTQIARVQRDARLRMKRIVADELTSEERPASPEETSRAAIIRSMEQAHGSNASAGEYAKLENDAAVQMLHSFSKQNKTDEKTGDLVRKQKLADISASEKSLLAEDKALSSAKQDEKVIQRRKEIAKYITSDIPQQRQRVISTPETAPSGAAPTTTPTATPPAAAPSSILGKYVQTGKGKVADWKQATPSSTPPATSQAKPAARPAPESVGKPYEGVSFDDPEATKSVQPSKLSAIAKSLNSFADPSHIGKRTQEYRDALPSIVTDREKRASDWANNEHDMVRKEFGKVMAEHGYSEQEQLAAHQHVTNGGTLEIDDSGDVPEVKLAAKAEDGSTYSIPIRPKIPIDKTPVSDTTAQ